MSQSRRWTAACVFALLLGFPRTGSAGIWDFIVEMSGPQMIGGMSGCSVDFTGDAYNCAVLGFPVKWNPFEERRQMWLFLEGGTYGSTGKDQGENDLKTLRNFMLTFDPMLAFRTKLGRYHAVGITYNFVFGTNFKRFQNVGIKTRPIVIRISRFEFDYNLRLYPNGFDVVGPADRPGVSKGSEFEWVHGISASMAF